mmetsp:Transcript_10408/g.15585  ORF Transcript_10408/g.15585 Transcript_10408/m.15585 type:complete len:307 (+) Transcript_10408:87-1007(+)
MSAIAESSSLAQIIISSPLGELSLLLGSQLLLAALLLLVPTTFPMLFHDRFPHCGLLVEERNLPCRLHFLAFRPFEFQFSSPQFSLALPPFVLLDAALKLFSEGRVRFVEGARGPSRHLFLKFLQVGFDLLHLLCSILVQEGIRLFEEIHVESSTEVVESRVSRMHDLLLRSHWCHRPLARDLQWGFFGFSLRFRGALARRLGSVGGCCQFAKPLLRRRCIQRGGSCGSCGSYCSSFLLRLFPQLRSAFFFLLGHRRRLEFSLLSEGGKQRRRLLRGSAHVASDIPVPNGKLKIKMIQQNGCEKRD